MKKEALDMVMQAYLEGRAPQAQVYAGRVVRDLDEIGLYVSAKEVREALERAAAAGWLVGPKNELIESRGNVRGHGHANVYRNQISQEGHILPRDRALAALQAAQKEGCSLVPGEKELKISMSESYDEALRGLFNHFVSKEKEGHEGGPFAAIIRELLVTRQALRESLQKLECVTDLLEDASLPDPFGDGKPSNVDGEIAAARKFLAPFGVEAVPPPVEVTVEH